MGIIEESLKKTKEQMLKENANRLYCSNWCRFEGSGLWIKNESVLPTFHIDIVSSGKRERKKIDTVYTDDDTYRFFDVSLITAWVIRSIDGPDEFVVLLAT